MTDNYFFRTRKSIVAEPATGGFDLFSKAIGKKNGKQIKWGLIWLHILIIEWIDPSKPLESTIWTLLTGRMSMRTSSAQTTTARIHQLSHPLLACRLKSSMRWCWRTRDDFSSNRIMLKSSYWGWERIWRILRRWKWGRPTKSAAYANAGSLKDKSSVFWNVSIYFTIIASFRGSPRGQAVPTVVLISRSERGDYLI